MAEALVNQWKPLPFVKSADTRFLPHLPLLTPPLLGAGGPAYPVFLTMDQAAKMIHVSKQTIRRRIRSGELPAKRLKGGQTVLIDQKDVLALLEDITPGTDV